MCSKRVESGQRTRSIIQDRGDLRCGIVLHMCVWRVSWHRNKRGCVCMPSRQSNEVRWRVGACLLAT